MKRKVEVKIVTVLSTASLVPRVVPKTRFDWCACFTYTNDDC